ncbi:MAG TPA: NAD(P)H-hydrate dehydratase [Aggregatilineales bacterium]|nr:NAD(P)H-hydrate dehydratase [Aggregatilineales bacterium]
MVTIYKVNQIRQLESEANATGMSYATMMENAGKLLAQRIQATLSHKTDGRVTFLIGGGNNGGDGLVAARLVANTGATVRCYLLKARSESDPLIIAARTANITIALAEHDRDGRVLRNMVASADVIVDALFGIGVRLPLEPDAARLLRLTNQALNQDSHQEFNPLGVSNPALPQRSLVIRPYVIAVDCPSGLNCDTGELDPNTLAADETVTFIGAKPGLLQFPGADNVGRLHIADIGLPPNLPTQTATTPTLIDADWVRTRLPSRRLDANKGSFGKVLIAAGSEHYIGAAGLAGKAAAVSGSGLVTVASQKFVIQALAGNLLEITWIPLDESHMFSQELKGRDALLLGPGWGQSTATRTLLIETLTYVRESQPALPVILDADALNLLAQSVNWSQLLPPHCILTPHPGEMARLTGRSINDIQANRWALAQEKAAEWGCVILLKGAHTVITASDGQLAVLPFKNPVLATAGSGDVLAGIMVSLLGQGMSPFESAAAAGYLHGLTGETIAEKLPGKRGSSAMDILAALPESFSQLAIGQAEAPE